MAQTKKKTTKKSSPAKSTRSKSASGSRGKSAAPAERRPSPLAGRGREVTAAVLFLLAVFTCIGYFNTEGVFINFICGLFKGLVGWGFYIVPPMLLLCSLLLLLSRGRPVALRCVSALLLTVITGALVHLLLIPKGSVYGTLWDTGRELSSGGLLGGGLSSGLTYLFSRVGAFIVLFLLLAICVLVVCHMTLRSVVDAFRGEAQKKRERREQEYERRVQELEQEEQYPPHADEVVPPPQPIRRRRRQIDFPLDVDGDDAAEEEPRDISEVPFAKADAEPPLFKTEPGVTTPAEHLRASSRKTDIPVTDVPVTPLREEKPAAPEKSADKGVEAVDIPAPESVPAVEYAFPPLDLLETGGAASRGVGGDEAKINSERLEAAFASFGVRVRVSNFTRGPTVTRYEAELEAGIKLSRLTSLSEDIALSLGVSGVRIAAMPNKISTVGIEVPNKLVSTVYLRDIINSPEFKNSPSPLTFAIGKNIGGDSIVGNISKLPHLLVAGTTGSGKSVCLNSMILSILYKSTPEQVRFIMIDPKMVEFKVYNGIPHLLVPVVTEAKKAAGALQWAVVEMMKRYRLFSDQNARDIEGYNRAIRQTEGGVPLPQLVVVIDELADLMLTAAKEVEESICRVAQMGRAAGVHLVIATQSPRADVITGLMKANIPSRIALKVSSALESRIILDSGGNADKLVGNGDMLYAPIGVSKPIRIQGTWVSDGEREKVVEFIKHRGSAQYAEDVISQIEKAAAEKDKSSRGSDDEQDAPANDYDELLPQAVELVLESGQASVSMLQRRLKLGYSRAARIVDQMEDMGVVGPFEGSKPRQLLITRQQWQEMQFVNGTAPIQSVPDIPEPEPELEETEGEDVPF